MSIFTQTIPDSFQLAVINNKGSLFQGLAKAISPNNTIGPLSILPGHANFISIITDDLRVVDLADALHEFEIELGVIRVFANEVEIYVGVETFGPEFLELLNKPE